MIKVGLGTVLGLDNKTMDNIEHFLHGHFTGHAETTTTAPVPNPDAITPKGTLAPPPLTVPKFSKLEIYWFGQRHTIGLYFAKKIGRTARLDIINKGKLQNAMNWIKQNSTEEKYLAYVKEAYNV